MGQRLHALGSDTWRLDALWDASLCQHVIEVADHCEFLSPPPGSSLTGEPRSNEVLPLRDADALLLSTNQLLIGALAIARDLLAAQYDTTFSHIELYAIERFRPGQTHKRHHDGLILSDRYTELARGLAARDVTLLGFLNDDFEGGQVVLDRQSIKVEPVQGGVVAFPACYTHPYQTLPVRRGCKYSVLAWLIH